MAWVKIGIRSSYLTFDNAVVLATVVWNWSFRRSPTNTRNAKHFRSLTYCLRNLFPNSTVETLCICLPGFYWKEKKNGPTQSLIFPSYLKLWGRNLQDARITPGSFFCHPSFLKHTEKIPKCLSFVGAVCFGGKSRFFQKNSKFCFRKHILVKENLSMCILWPIGHLFLF